MKKIESILYVEDEKNVQHELSDFLAMYCKTLHIADNGIEGLTNFKEFSPSLVISDIKMPKMNGLEMVRKIYDENPDVFVIFTTAFSDILYLQEALELQVDGYLLKPIDLDQLDRKIDKITNQLFMRKELQHKEKILKQQSKLASMGEMIGNIAHQWRQPLNVISSNITAIMIDLDMQKEIDKEVLRDCTKNVTKNVQYLSQTIDDFLGFLKPMSNVEKFNIKYFSEKLFDLMKPSIEYHNIKLISNIDNELIVYADQKQLLQILIIILNNSKDVLIQHNNDSEKIIIVEIINNETKVIIDIYDNGGGIDQDIIEKIFEPYFTTKHESLGTGLGLYVAYNIIVNNLQGDIYVANKKFIYDEINCYGARFRIELPLINN